MLLKTAANALGVAVSAKVAAGAAEALELGFGPQQRLLAITREATRNVAEHAYADRTPGAMELQIELVRADGRLPQEPVAGEVLVSIHDHGCGCPLTPSASDPPGLGLAMIYELSDGLTVRTRRDEGTEIDASVAFARGDTDPAPDSESDPAASPTESSELTFGHPSFIAPVLTRVLAAHAVALGATIDAAARTIEWGKSIAHQLDAGSRTPTIVIVAERAPTRLQVRIGPLPRGRAKRLLDRWRSPRHAGETSGVEVDGGDAPAQNPVVSTQFRLL